MGLEIRERASARDQPSGARAEPAERIFVPNSPTLAFRHVGECKTTQVLQLLHFGDAIGLIVDDRNLAEGVVDALFGQRCSDRACD